jgi:hypothetical protein
MCLIVICGVSRASIATASNQVNGLTEDLIALETENNLADGPLVRTVVCTTADYFSRRLEKSLEQEAANTFYEKCRNYDKFDFDIIGYKQLFYSWCYVYSARCK